MISVLCFFLSPSSPGDQGPQEAATVNVRTQETLESTRVLIIIARGSRPAGSRAPIHLDLDGVGLFDTRRGLFGRCGGLFDHSCRLFDHRRCLFGHCCGRLPPTAATNLKQGTVLHAVVKQATGVVGQVTTVKQAAAAVKQAAEVVKQAAVIEIWVIGGTAPLLLSAACLEAERT